MAPLDTLEAGKLMIQLLENSDVQNSDAVTYRIYISSDSLESFVDVVVRSTDNAKKYLEPLTVLEPIWLNNIEGRFFFYSFIFV